MTGTSFTKILISLMLMTTYLFGFSQLGSFAFNRLVNSQNFTPNTSIGSVSVGGESTNSSMELVEEAIEQWGKTGEVLFSYVDNTVEIPLEFFTFDVEGSVGVASDSATNSLFVTIDREGLLAFIEKQFLLSENQLLVEELLNSLQRELSFLPSTTMIPLEEYVSTSDTREVLVEVISEPITIEPSLTSITNNLSSIQLKENTMFSLNDTITDRGITVKNENSLTLVGSLLYELFLSTNFLIVERSQSQSLSEGIRLGYEAKVSPSNQIDFVVANPNATMYELSLKLKGNRLVAELIGPAFPQEFKPLLKEEETFDPKTIIQYSPQVTSVEVKEEGKEGVMVTVYRQSFDSKGTLIEDEFISEDFYPPVHRIEIHQSKRENTTVTSGDSKGQSDGATDSGDSSNGTTNPDTEGDGESSGEDSEKDKDEEKDKDKKRG
ncbi:VanW family protein [Bacillus coahuilensis]|uniref:VanW family protein n=1 Tax=Bacillus coahuilensis TaxID=408580 RepID=UPI000185082E|nr:VanW family protein [Bacillus coahuilensis]